MSPVRPRFAGVAWRQALPTPAGRSTTLSPRRTRAPPTVASSSLGTPSTSGWRIVPLHPQSSVQAQELLGGRALGPLDHRAHRRVARGDGRPLRVAQGPDVQEERLLDPAYRAELIDAVVRAVVRFKSMVDSGSESAAMVRE